MTVRSVIQSGRGEGKTTAMMNLIHSQIMKTGPDSVKVIFPDHGYVQWWIREWQNRFGLVPAPRYLTHNNLMPIRGHRLVKVYVEDADRYEDGIYDQKIWNAVAPALAWHADSEIVYTASLNPLNQRSHSRIVTKEEMMKERLRKSREQKEMERAAMFHLEQASPHALQMLEAIAKETWQS